MWQLVYYYSKVLHGNVALLVGDLAVHARKSHDMTCYPGAIAGAYIQVTAQRNPLEFHAKYLNPHSDAENCAHDVIY